MDNLLYAGIGANVLYGASSGISVSLAIPAAQATSGSDSDTLIRIENLSGSTYADPLTGESRGPPVASR